MPLPMKASARPRGQSQVGRSSAVRGQRKGKLAAELRSFASRAQSPAVVPTAVSLRKRLTTLKATRSTGRFSPPRGPDRAHDRPARGPDRAHDRPRRIKALAVPRPGDLRSAAVSLSRGRIPQGSLLGDIVTAIRQPLIRQTAPAGGAHTAGLNIRNQLGVLDRQRLHAQRASNVRSTSDQFRFGQRQIGRVVARRRGTPVGSGQPTHRPR